MTTQKIENPRVAMFLPTCRPDYLKCFLDSMDCIPENFKLYVAFQAYSLQDFAPIKSSRNYGRITGAITLPQRHPPYPTRMMIYKKWYDDVDVWISLDDDMEFIAGLTDYTKAIEKVLEPYTGVVSCNWARTLSLLEKKSPEDRFIKQAITNMSGGMLYSRKVIDILFDSPVEPFLFCDMQVPLMCYIRGYDNYRYLGSLIIHKIMTKGGLIQTFREMDMALPDPELINLKATSHQYQTNNNWGMPVPSDVTEKAHQLHKDNRRKLENG